MKKVLLPLILAAVAFVLPCMAESRFGYCYVFTTDSRAFFSDLFSVDSTVSAGRLQTAFKTHVDGNYSDLVIHTSGCSVTHRTRGDARKRTASSGHPS